MSDTSDPEVRKFGARRKAILAGVATLVLAPLAVWAIQTYAPGGIEKLRHEPPVAVSATEDSFASYMVIPSGTAIPEEPVQRCNDQPQCCNGFTRSLRRHGGVGDQRKTFVRLTVQSQSSDRTLITAIEPKILRRRPPLSGLLVLPPCPTGGGEPATKLNFDLDRGRATKKDFTPHTVSRTDPEVFDITASARLGSYDWIPQLTIVRNGKIQTVDARPGNRSEHFTTRGLVQTDKHVYSFDGQRWWRTEGLKRLVPLTSPPPNP